MSAPTCLICKREIRWPRFKRDPHPDCLYSLPEGEAWLCGRRECERAYCGPVDVIGAQEQQP